MKIWILTQTSEFDGNRIIGMWSSFPSADQIAKRADIDIDQARDVIDKGGVDFECHTTVFLTHETIPAGEFK